MAVPLLDLKRQYAPIRAEIDRAVKQVFDHCGFIMGPEVKAFEAAAAEFCRTRHAVGVASGSDALLLALRACGVGPGDEVITSAFSFFASAGVIDHLGAVPVFVDIEPDTYNIDPAQIEKAVTAKTKVIMPIHLFGQCANMDPILNIAATHGLKVVEDAAQAIGSQYKGRSAGSIGDMGCFSFFPTKNLGCAGDGGMITTNDDALADMVRLLRQHGGRTEYVHEVIGYNSRLDTLQAAILLVKLPHLRGWTDSRRHNAARYNAAFAGLPLKTPAVRDWAYHIYNQYTVACDNRDKLLAWLKDRQIGHKIYYPVPFHFQHCFAGLGYKAGDFPQAEKAGKTVVSLPIFGEMTATEQDEVIDAVVRFFA
ncbi:MAG: DegT/DnrJ/EryC1/StrS family aminotransferase [candidate division Zixibacteria bacterium]|nr:DegT/DnrJ/EryC1/StrS family aminotransferase [candidate division Zixibacteria bacterium]